MISGQMATPVVTTVFLLALTRSPLNGLRVLASASWRVEVTGLMVSRGTVWTSCMILRSVF